MSRSQLFGLLFTISDWQPLHFCIWNKRTLSGVSSPLWKFSCHGTITPKHCWAHRYRHKLDYFITVKNPPKHCQGFNIATEHWAWHCLQGMTHKHIFLFCHLSHMVLVVRTWLLVSQTNVATFWPYIMLGCGYQLTGSTSAFQSRPYHWLVWLSNKVCDERKCFVLMVLGAGRSASV